MTFFVTAGICALIYVAVRLGTFIYRLLCPVRIDVNKFGPWALVTGSTDGIGKAYAAELAKRGEQPFWRDVRLVHDDYFSGLNLVLVSRTKEKLDQVAKEIQSQSPKAQVKTIAVDFTRKIPTIVGDELEYRWSFDHLEDNSIYATIRDGIRSLDIGILINNVGMSYEYPEYFDKVEGNEAFLNKMIRCNVDSVANLTQMLLPGLSLVFNSRLISDSCRYLI